MDSQSKSTMSPGLDTPQLSLLPMQKTKVCPPVDVTYLRSIPTLRRAIRYSVSLFDLEPKQIFEPLEMDKAIWSRIENGSMSFPADELVKLSAITQNKAPFLWLAHQFGYDIERLPMLRDDKDRRIAELELQLAQERHDRAVITKFVSERMR
jgi:hypothetical protein